MLGESRGSLPNLAIPCLAVPVSPCPSLLPPRRAAAAAPRQRPSSADLLRKVKRIEITPAASSSRASAASTTRVQGPRRRVRRGAPLPAGRRRAHHRLERHRPHGLAVRQAVRRGARPHGVPGGRRLGQPRLRLARHPQARPGGRARRTAGVRRAAQPRPRRRGAGHRQAGAAPPPQRRATRCCGCAEISTTPPGRTDLERRCSRAAGAAQRSCCHRLRFRRHAADRALRRRRRATTSSCSRCPTRATSTPRHRPVVLRDAETGRTAVVDGRRAAAAHHHRRRASATSCSPAPEARRRPPESARQPYLSRWCVLRAAPRRLRRDGALLVVAAWRPRRRHGARDSGRRARPWPVDSADGAGTAP